ncbi:MAG: phosphoadenosine phosphosulfate reductase family protein [Clostridiales bacterium]|nr:phosphoadenosine phosphosulfate reductase family protein [Clostridiales bacterium]
MNNSLIEKEKTAIERFKAFETNEGYHLSYSGGKDSDVIKILAELSGVKFEAVYRHTSVDAPETVRYIKSQKDIHFDIPRYKNGEQITMWNLIVKKMSPPLRLSRYCCSELKESTKDGRIVVTGVRWAESTARKARSSLVHINGKPKTTMRLAEELNAGYEIKKGKYLVLQNDNDENKRLVEHCFRTQKVSLNPIIDWTDNDVWEFLNHYGCKSNPLYSCGYKRIGCIGCPMASTKNREFEFNMYPKYKENYIKAFDRMLAARKKAGLKLYDNQTDGQGVFDWWMSMG